MCDEWCWGGALANGDVAEQPGTPPSSRAGFSILNRAVRGMVVATEGPTGGVTFALAPVESVAAIDLDMPPY